ncbi:hypothetical protein C8R31_102567 [Nitrosospira sp. Nsp2]|uniref:hypothetical protein n=1 Tax=Nitrosospira sp. Nsp2 TaxID=136548 RepID=UPI000D3190BF|nr:hypothetical protein [Nitrosospira sp. Nsp2]PTR16550.1 hypothetical protein C8R31_102567 [Nitrosospira sp. Nsp2]
MILKNYQTSGKPVANVTQLLKLYYWTEVHLGNKAVTWRMKANRQLRFSGRGRVAWTQRHGTLYLERAVTIADQK